MSRSGDSDPLLGRVLDGKFTLLSVLGRGGMGVVYRAHQKSLERPVALKLMMANSAGSEATEEEQARDVEFQRRFFLEAATAAKLKHPNTITVFDYGSTVVDDEKVFYITMELLDGITLSKLLSNEGPLPPLRAINIGLQICRSLREAHVGGIVHRDLKPGNVMLVRHDAGDGDVDGDKDDDGDFVKVLDFGLAKTRTTGASGRAPQLTKAGTFLGSPRYVAPEQIEGRAVDGRADIYSFGCVFYRMLTGRVPFDGQQAVEVMLKHLHDAVPPVSTPEVPVSSTLEQLVLKCLEKKAADRPSTMDDVIAVLKRARAEITGVQSGNINIPDDLRARLIRELGEGANSGPLPVPVPAPTTTKPTTAETKRPTGPIANPVRIAIPRAESTSPSQARPDGGGAKPPKDPSSSSSQPPSLSPISLSGEWKIGPASASDESTRPTHVMGRLSVIEAKRRKPGAAIAAGVVVGVLLAGVLIAGRLGHLDDLLDRIVDVTSPDPPPTPAPRPPPTLATEKASARLRIKTQPEGADVFDVGGGGVPRLLGITPLVIPWEIAVGDPGRELLLKLPGHVAARARVEPPSSARSKTSTPKDPVVLDVKAALRPQPAR
ncbi:MAG: serine/threonine-protein kinase [Deltaproteobacteria bacterium]|nr:serine/threonine-protein kinase [Deltaproteobacteria bacterium]